ncbi:tape measure protein [Pseudomonas lundensis]|uniref:tape measure protein n=1 Tax=Pseudomonas lundensis TaxID=86185 RepID=UPI0014754D6C|nr:tape measure protein [Pseudomonas lundensis]NMZ99132.1 tape measure protein [Pseudomonas lundensis]
MPGKTLRSLIVSVSAQTVAYQREMARAGRMGRDYLRTISSGNREASAGWRAQEAAIRSQHQALGSLTGAVGGYVRAMAGALAVGNLIGIADEWGQIASRLKLATRSQDDFLEAQTRLMDIGRLTFKAYSENAELFIRSVAVLREFGGTAEDALNMTEALSLGLAVSGTKAQATASVIDQVSKSLQNGKLHGDGFNAVVTQAPRLLQALQDALGKSRAELQRMASDGQLTVDVVAKGWISQIGLMRQETEGMATSVADAGLRLRDAFAQYIGTADNGAQVTARLAQTINLVADNLGTFSAVAIGAGLGLIAKAAAQNIKALYGQVAATRLAYSAELGRARGALDTALLVQRSTQEVILAERRLAAVTAVQHLSRATHALTAAKLADYQATRAATAAQAAYAAAASLSARALSGVGAILGGPVGLALLVGTTAASFLLFSENADKAGASAYDLQRPLSELRKEWEALSNAQRRPILKQLLDQQAEAKRQADQVLRDIQQRAQLLDKWGKNYSAGPNARRRAALDFGRDMVAGQDIDRATQALAKAIGPSQQLRDEIEGLAGAYSRSMATADETGQRIDALSGILREAQTAAEGVSAGLQSIKPPDEELTSAWERRISNLTEQLERLRDDSTLGEIKRQAERDNLAQTEQGRALLARAQAVAQLKDAEQSALRTREQANRHAQQAAAAALREAQQLEDQYLRTLQALREQLQADDQKTEQAKVQAHITQGSLSQLEDLKKAELQRAAVAVDQLNSQRGYQALLSDIQQQEDNLLETARKRFAELERLRRQGGLSAEQYQAGAAAISGASVGKAPMFSGLDASVGGPSAELMRIAEVERELQQWREKELERQQRFLDEKLINEQLFQDRVAEITQQSNDRLSAIQDAYRSATLSVFSELTGNAADMLKQLAGEGSAAYKLLFLASKAAAMAQAIINTEVAATKALELGPAGPAAAAIVRALGYASVGMIAATTLVGMAHEGLDNVPKTGTWLLQQGERVVDGRTNRDLKQFLAQPAKAVGAAQAMPSVQVQISIDARGNSSLAVTTQSGAQQFAQQMVEMIEVAVRQVIRQEQRQNGLLDATGRR